MRGLDALFDGVSKCTCAPGFVFSPSGFCISHTHASVSAAAPVGGENERESARKKRVSGLAATRALRALFDALDRDEDGALSREELVAVLPSGLPLAPVEHLVSKEQRAAWLQVPVIGFTSTEVRILTADSSAVLQSADTNADTQFTCFTSTKVRILTADELQSADTNADSVLELHELLFFLTASSSAVSFRTFVLVTHQLSVFVLLY
jgi:hypothetical protein